MKKLLLLLGLFGFLIISFPISNALGMPMLPYFIFAQIGLIVLAYFVVSMYNQFKSKKE